MRGVGGGVGGPPLRDHLWQGPPLPVTLRLIHPPAMAANKVTAVHASAPAIYDLSWLNPTPHAIAVYASQPLSPAATQHSLPSGRYSLLGPDLHRLDRTSLRLAHLLDYLVGASKERGRKREPELLGGLAYFVGPMCAAESRQLRRPPISRVIKTSELL